ncbi:response regulator [Enterococcus cecorum]|nr:response regulator [Enterococcus cecorum]CAI3322131.1 response regulator [Enterococcus cecorum]
MEDFKVMVVDDEISVRQGIKNLISWINEGFELSIEATNGKEALKLMPIFQPHILLTDLVMPEMDGIELISQAKKLNPDIEIIVISSYDTFYLIKECFRLGVKDYILKPELSPQLLLQTLRKVTNQFIQKSNEHNFSHEKILSEEISRYLSGYHQSLVLTHLDQLFPYHNYCFF